MPRVPKDVFSAFTTPALRGFLVTYREGCGASRLPRTQLIELLISTLAAQEAAFLQTAARRPITDKDDMTQFMPSVQRRMRERYGSIYDTFRRAQLGHGQHASNASSSLTEERGSANTASAPTSTPMSAAVPLVTMDEQGHGTDSTAAALASTSSSARVMAEASDLQCKRYSINDFNLDLLSIHDPHLLARPAHHFQYNDPALDGLALHAPGVHTSSNGTELDICSECHPALSAGTLPAHALANGNVRGFLPAHLSDCTWLEERLCSVYLASACVVRLYECDSPGAPEQRSRVMKGHTCAFPMNTVSTATALPWELGTSGPLLTCLVIGPRKPRIEDLRNVFRVRRRVVQDLFLFLREHCKDYPQFPLNQAAVDTLPEDGVPDSILSHVVYQQADDATTLFARETSGLDTHPALLADEQDGVTMHGQTFLEHHGLLDVDAVDVDAPTRMVSALSNATGAERPDLVIRHGAGIVDESNPALFPGMFPTLFPWGTGGFRLPRQTPLGFDRQAKYLLDLSDPCFRRHWSFIFIVANMKHRRGVLRGCNLVCKSSDFDRFSKQLSELTPDVVKGIAARISRGGTLNNLTTQEKRIFALLGKCDVASVHVPGSRAIMNRARADIRAYIGRFGIFQLFLTLNPSATHSPVFQIFFGDTSVQLDTSRPSMPPLSQRGIRVADDPVAASDYFHFHGGFSAVSPRS
ncbi:hypothetical protein OC834_003968 [Tilletia horrida]|nr:hypothetical protein OC834_003968 [Tilletia horrida]